MKNSDSDTNVILIMFVIAVLALVIAIYKDSLFASFISGFMFSGLLEDHLKSSRIAKENSE